MNESASQQVSKWAGESETGIESECESEGERNGSESERNGSESESGVSQSVRKQIALFLLI